MVIGAKGQKLKTIGTKLIRSMERLFDNKVHLELWVKLNPAGLMMSVHYAV